MIESAVFKWIESLTGSKPSKPADSTMNLLIGYAKLLSMNEGVLNSLFQKEEEQEDLKKIREVMEERKIDVALLRTCAGFLQNRDADEDDKRELEEVLRKYEEHDGHVLAADILQDLLSLNIPELDLVKQGHTVEDVLAYLDSQKPKEAPKKKAAPENASGKPVEKDRPSEEAKPAAGGEVKADEEAEAAEGKDPEASGEAAKETSKAEKKAGQKAEKEAENVVEKEASEAEEEKSSAASAMKFQILVNKATQLYDRLKLRVMGQDEAIRLFASGYFQSEVLRDEETDRKGPSATFLFAGPPGVGKTYLANSAAEILKMPFLRLDMSEFSEDRTSVERLTGIAKNFQGSQPGILTEYVKKNPRSIILLDEIEKAHMDVIYQFLQVLDGGMLTDSCTRETVDFSETILIFTTNVGKSLYEDHDRQNLSALPRSVVIKAIKEEKNQYGNDAIPAALCSRFASGNLLMFNHLEVHTLVDIINKNIRETVDKVKNAYKIEIEVDDKVAPVLLYSQSSRADARNVSSQSVIMIKNEMYEFGRHAKTSLETLKKLRFRVEVDPENQAVYSLFHNGETSKILFIGNKEDVSTLPLSENCEMFYAGDRKEAMDILAKEEISFVLLDLYCGAEEQERKYLSLDDWKSEGVLTFENLNEKMPNMPVFIVDKHDISNEDQAKFLEMGARAFIKYKPKKKLEFADRIAWIADMIYMQKKVDELSGRGRVLTYNSAQRFLEDGETAEILFYDFKIRVAADAAENQMMVSDNERPKERFDDVIGAQNAKDELAYFVKFMQNPKAFMKTNSVKPPKGILFYGPPGTGKTMLARAMAGECNATFFPTTAASFQRPHVGEGEAAISELFATAKKYAPSIIFIDEIDAIGKERTGASISHVTELYLNTLLTEMDGFEVNLQRPVFVIAATNYNLERVNGKAGLDEALLRRFDNRIMVDLPNEDERKQFLELKLSKIEEHEVTTDAVNSIATRTTGESLAILQNVLSLAVRNAMKGDSVLNDTYLLNALEEYMYGEKREWDEDYYKSVSIHESGHAYVCSLSGEHPSFVTIVSRGNYGGYMQHENQEKNPAYTRDQLIWQIRTSLAGRAAELEFFGEEGINTGISSDLSHATRTALNYICRFAMADAHMLSLSPEQVLNTKRGEQILEQAEKMLEEEMEKTKQLVHEGREKIQALAEFLQKNNQATEDQIADLLGFPRKER